MNVKTVMKILNFKNNKFNSDNSTKKKNVNNKIKTRIKIQKYYNNLSYIKY